VKNDDLFSTEIIRRAIALSNYQLRMRRRHKPVSGENPWAVLENMICQVMKEHRRLTKRQLFKKLHAERYGRKNFRNALEELERDGVIRIVVDRTKTRPTQIIEWLGD
jgi:hypothetical protein